uniref:Uncharacterized protein n=1 Tax=Rhodopseudomonas palustris (strain BisA53) TaxID=316055 RepID=Q07TC1_RHOP5
MVWHHPTFDLSGRCFVAEKHWTTGSDEQCSPMARLGQVRPRLPCLSLIVCAFKRDECRFARRHRRDNHFELPTRAHRPDDPLVNRRSVDG